jgi:hypothetical protein
MKRRIAEPINKKWLLAGTPVELFLLLTQLQLPLRMDLDMLLQAEGYAGEQAGRLGVFELQEEVVQGRPTYKKPEEGVPLLQREGQLDGGRRHEQVGRLVEGEE